MILEHLFCFPASTPNSASDHRRMATLQRRFVEVEPRGITGSCDWFIMKLGCSVYGLFTYSRWKMTTWTRVKWLGKYFVHGAFTRWWNFKYVFIFNPIPGERKWSNFDEHIFQMGWFTTKWIPRFFGFCEDDIADGRNPAPLGLQKKTVNNGISYLSTGAGFLPSTVWMIDFKTGQALSIKWIYWEVDWESFFGVGIKKPKLQILAEQHFDWGL